MNTQAYTMAKQAYQAGDWAGAVSALAAAKAAGELSGEVDHLKGNALMKLGRYAQAADAYADALADGSYGHTGALNCNRGRALVAAGQSEAAEACFNAAVADPSYATPYKAYLALGNLYSRRGMAREAGMAWRSAAIDEANPDPSVALSKLGGCFMTLGRPVDAIEAYRTALDFSPEGGQGAIYGDLGLAYMAANRVAEAQDAFAQAASDPAYQLTAEQQASLAAAQKALAAAAGGVSETDQLLAQAGYGQQPAQTEGMLAQQPSQGFAGVPAAVADPLDPMGKSGEFMPNPEDTGFFSVTEEDLMAADRGGRKMRRKHSHRGAKIFGVILLLLLIVGGAAAFAYYKGFGWPTQEATIEGLFSAAGGDLTSYLADGLDSSRAEEIADILPEGATVSVEGVTRDTMESTAQVEATLSQGGTQTYEVTLLREGIGWKVSDVELYFASSSSTSTTTTGTLATGTSSSDVQDTTATDTTATDTTATDASVSEATTDEAIQEPVQ